MVTGLPPARGAVSSRVDEARRGLRRGAPSGAAVAHRQRVGHGDRAEETCHGVDLIKSLRGSASRLAAQSSLRM